MSGFWPGTCQVRLLSGVSPVFERFGVARARRTRRTGNRCLRRKAVVCYIPSVSVTQTARSFFWKPAGFVSSMDLLDPAHGLLGRYDVTVALGGPYQRQHPLTVVELSRGKVIGDLRVVATADDTVIGGLQRLFGSVAPLDHYSLHRRRFRFPKFRRRTALLLGTPNSDNYYHWMLESFPRWKILQTAGCGQCDFVLLHGCSGPFHYEMMGRLGVPAEKCLRCSKNFVHQFERLIVPAMPFPCVEAPPDWVVTWLRSLFPPESSGPPKIYLRRGEGRRRLVNEPELEAALQDRGFAVVEPGRLTVAEQAKWLGSARCVVAPHGAALTNLVFAPPGATLLEIFHPQHKNLTYANLAAVCGHAYAGVDGYAVNRGGQEMEYTVDVASVLNALGNSI
jgi:hypothetical protein